KTVCNGMTGQLDRAGHAWAKRNRGKERHGTGRATATTGAAARRRPDGGPGECRVSARTHAAAPGRRGTRGTDGAGDDPAPRAPRARGVRGPVTPAGGAHTRTHPAEACPNSAGPTARCTPTRPPP